MTPAYSEGDLVRGRRDALKNTLNMYKSVTGNVKYLEEFMKRDSLSTSNINRKLGKSSEHRTNDLLPTRCKCTSQFGKFSALGLEEGGGWGVGA